MPLLDAIFDAAKQDGHATNGDYNLDHNGYHRVQASITQNGVRGSTARQYLRPVMDRHNLHVITNALVTKVYVYSCWAQVIDFT